MKNGLRRLEDAVSTLKLDDSLLFLNHVLGVSRGYTNDPALVAAIARYGAPIPTHVVHFLARLLLLHASNLGTRSLTWHRFCQLQRMCIGLDDAISHDPNWQYADPSGFLERLFSQQLPTQRQIVIQKYGLALGLFRDVGTVQTPRPYDLREDIESELGMPLERFMAFGNVAFGLARANYCSNKCIGTFTHMYLADAFAQGIDICVPETWSGFLNRVACDRDRFRAVANLPLYGTRNDLFEPFAFNLLRRFPIVDLGESRYLAPDPELIVERVTTGLFYDLFEKDGTKFSDRFGHSFERYVGELLSTICPTERLWCASDWERTISRKGRKTPKIGDWIYSGNQCRVIFDCKSLRPSLELTTYGSKDRMDELDRRVANALDQLNEHAQSINRGEWVRDGLQKDRAVGIIVTYGKFFTINGPFARKRIQERFAKDGLEPIPYAVLSIEELDNVIRLVELGHPLDQLLQSLATDVDSFDPLQSYHEELRESAVSSTTMTKGKQFLDSILAKRVHASSAT